MDGRGGRPYIRLVAAGVVFRGHQREARMGFCWLGLGWMAERAQDPKYGDVGGEDAEADGGDHGEAEDNGHQERNHGLKILLIMSAKAGHSVLGESQQRWSAVVAVSGIYRLTT